MGYLKTTMTWLSVSSNSASSGFLLDFFKRISQYLANNSGDLLFWFDLRVTQFVLMNLPQALSRAATKPLSLLKAVKTRALYLRCTSKIVLTYNLGSCNVKREIYNFEKNGKKTRENVVVLTHLI